MKKSKNKQEKNIVQKDNGVLDISLGAILVALNNFTGGQIYEKILILLGLVLIIVGVIRTIPKYTGGNKRWIPIFLILIGCTAFGMFITFLIEFFATLL